MYHSKILSFRVSTKLTVFTESSSKMRFKSEALVMGGGGGGPKKKRGGGGGGGGAGWGGERQTKNLGAELSRVTLVRKKRAHTWCWHRKSNKHALVPKFPYT